MPAFSRINLDDARRGATPREGGGEAEGNAARTALLLSTGSPQPWQHVHLPASLLRGLLLLAAAAARAPPFETGSGQQVHGDRTRARTAGSPGGVRRGADAQRREGCPLAALGRNPADAAAGCLPPGFGPVAPPPRCRARLHARRPRRRRRSVASPSRPRRGQERKAGQ